MTVDAIILPGLSLRPYKKRERKSELKDALENLFQMLRASPLKVPLKIKYFINRQQLRVAAFYCYDSFFHLPHLP